MLNVNNNVTNTNIKYSVFFNNESSNYGTVFIYQRYPNMINKNVITLAWLCRATHPLTIVNFSWTDNYNFIWSEIGELKYDTIIKSSQILDADLINENQVELDYENSAYKFKDLTRGKEGVLTIVQNSSIPIKKALVGICMSGYATSLVPAQPNKSTIFTPHPSYWIGFGECKQGEVIDIIQLSPTTKELKFGTDTHSLSVTLNMDNTWSVENIYDKL